MKENKKGKAPVVTILMILINVAVWMILEALGSTQESLFMLEHGASYAPFILENGEWWRLFTSMFLHFGAQHLCNNMLMLGLMGMRLEYVLGGVRFGILYLASGLCGSLLSVWQEMNAGDIAVSAGASGAVFGVVGGLIAWAVWHKGQVEGLTLKGLFGMAALSLYYGFSTAGVDNWGHIGGFLGGIVIGCIFAILSKIVAFKKRKPYTKEVDIQADIPLNGGNNEN